MSCMYYNYYACGQCPRFVKTTDIEYESDVLILTIPPMKLKNHDKICLCVTQTIPVEDLTPDTTIVIYVGDSTEKFTLATRLGNYFYADALKNRKVYPLYAATDSKTFMLQDLCKLGETDHQFPILPAVEVKPK